MSSTRFGVVGLGMMGRHHARLLKTLSDVEFIGAVDPNGDRYHALGSSPLFRKLEDLIDRGPEAVVVAAPTSTHESVGFALADAGIHTLIEKPLADTANGAQRIQGAFSTRPVVAAVGHVERFNPALQAMKSRLSSQTLGHLFSISTLRVGPFPDRIQDVGVVKDLATHDIDLIRWLGEADFAEVQGYTSHKMGRPHEDLLVCSGVLTNGVTINMQVNWLTPVKRRMVSVLGERGTLIADMLSADLTFHENGSIPVEWDEMARLRGVKEGNMIRYALHRPEPLRSELEAFRDAVRGQNVTSLVSLASGVETISVAERILSSVYTGAPRPMT